MNTLTIGVHDGCPCVRFGANPDASWWLVVDVRPNAVGQAARYLLRRLAHADILETALLQDNGWSCSCGERKLLLGCSHVRAVRLLRQFWGLVKPSELPAGEATGFRDRLAAWKDASS